MNTIYLLCTLMAVTLTHCSQRATENLSAKQVYQTPRLEILQLSPGTYRHISFKQTNDFGNVPCNGMIVKNGSEVIIFDTPTNDSAAQELIQWVNQALACSIMAVVPTHFHDDCLGGLKSFTQRGIPSYAHHATIALARQQQLPVPAIGFHDSLVLQVAGAPVKIRFFGEGHTADNVVAYYPKEQVLFGGCLIKEPDATKGYLGDANTEAWSSTVTKIKAAYPEVQLVVPGHGTHGDQRLLDYTIKLFRNP